MSSYSCLLCQDTFQGRQSLVFHLRHSHSDRINRFQCTFCSKILINSKTFSQHLKGHEDRGVEINVFVPNFIILFVGDRIVDLTLHETDKSKENEENPRLETAEVVAENQLLAPDDYNPMEDDLEHSSEASSVVNRFQDSIKDRLLRSTLSFYSNSSLTMIRAQEFIKTETETITTVLNLVKEITSSTSSIEELKTAIESLSLDDLSLSTRHLATKTLIEEGYYYEPRKFLIQNNCIQIINEDGSDFINVKYTGVVMPIKTQIKKFLELPGLLNAILEHQQFLQSSKSNDMISHFCQGSFWSEIERKYEGRIIIPVMLYMDDFSTDDPNSAHAKENTICGCYYSFPSLPGFLKSKIDYIFVAIIAKAKYLKSSPNSALYILLDIFLKLEKDGILLDTEFGERRVYIVLTYLQGDNLGLHNTLGLTTGFNGFHVCRFCLIHKSDSQRLCENSGLESRTIEK